MKIFLSFFGALIFASVASAVPVPLNRHESTLAFTGHAFLHDFDGHAADFSGTAEVDPRRPEAITSAVIGIKTPSLTTEEDGRDRNMRDWLQVNKNSEIVFHLLGVRLVKGDPAQARRDAPAKFFVRGNLTLAGQTRPLEASALGWRESGRLHVTGTTQIDTQAYGLPIVRQAFLTVEPHVDIAFHLVFDLPPALAL